MATVYSKTAKKDKSIHYIVWTRKDSPLKTDD